MDPEAKSKTVATVKKPSWLLPSLGVGALLIVAGLAIAVSQKHLIGQTHYCSDATVTTASHAIDEIDRPALEKVQQHILATKDYAKDQNCVYILLRASMINNDTASSRKYLTELKSLNKSYSKAFTSEVYSIDKSEQLVSYMEDHDKADRKEEASVNSQFTTMDQAADKQIQEQQ